MIPIGHQPTTFYQLLSLYKDLDFLRNDKTLILKRENIPVTISISRTTKTTKLQLDQSLSEGKNIQLQASQFKKKKDNQTTFCIIFGPKGTKIPKGTALARILTTETDINPTAEQGLPIATITQVPKINNKKRKTPKTTQDPQRVNIPQHRSQRIRVGGTRGHRAKICSMKAQRRCHLPIEVTPS